MLERLPIEAETALALEEAEHLLRQLTLLTERGRITWRCVHYNPLELMPFLTEGKPETAYITHSVMATGEYNGRSYLTEIGETLTIPGSEGNVSVELGLRTARRWRRASKKPATTPISPRTTSWPTR